MKYILLLLLIGCVSKEQTEPRLIIMNNDCSNIELTEDVDRYHHIEKGAVGLKSPKYNDGCYDFVTKKYSIMVCNDECNYKLLE